MNVRFLSGFAVIGVLIACTNNTADYGGQYSLSVTSASNDCGLSNWPSGPLTDAIIAVSQDSTNATVAQVTFSGAEGDLVNSLVGTRSISGTVRSNGFSGQATGQVPFSGGPCSSPTTVGVDVTLVLDGSNVTGTIDFGRTLPASCTTTCASNQTFSGVRSNP